VSGRQYFVDSAGGDVVRAIRDDGEGRSLLAVFLDQRPDRVGSRTGRLGCGFIGRGGLRLGPRRAAGAVPARHFRSGPEAFSVAARQLDFCSCVGTSHFDLRRVQHELSSVYRGWDRIS
jgi:hypothetical protein